MTAREIIDRVNEISFNSSLMREMRAIAFVQPAARARASSTAAHYKRMNIHLIEADERLEAARGVEQAQRRARLSRASEGDRPRRLRSLARPQLRSDRRQLDGRSGQRRICSSPASGAGLSAAWPVEGSDDDHRARRCRSEPRAAARARAAASCSARQLPARLAGAGRRPRSARTRTGQRDPGQLPAAGGGRDLRGTLHADAEGVHRRACRSSRCR